MINFAGCHQVPSDVFMKQQFITAAGIQLAYFEQNPEARQTLFFVHGNSVSSFTWRKQFADPRLAPYRLIALDLPAHGASAASPDPDRDYNLIRLGEIAAEALNLLVGGNDRFLLVGLSLGANIVAEMLDFNVRPAGIVLIGPSVVGGKYGLSDVIVAGADVSAVFADGVPEKTVRQYAATTSISAEPADLEAFLKDYHETRPPFRTVFFSSVGKGKYKNEVSLLGRPDLPVCIIFGIDERIVNPYYLDDVPLALWEGKIHRIPGASHLVHIDNPEGVNGLLAAYAGDRFRSDDA